MSSALAHVQNFSIRYSLFFINITPEKAPRIKPTISQVTKTNSLTSLYHGLILLKDKKVHQVVVFLPFENALKLQAD